jgi:hypothetical protein
MKMRVYCKCVKNRISDLDAYNKYNIEWDFQRNSAFRKRNTYLWYSLILYFVTIFDAVVDAH